MARINVLATSPFPIDANSMYRGMGPWNYVQKASKGEIAVHQLALGTACAWNTIDAYDLIFLHRPCRQDDLIMLQLAKLLGIPVIVDYDDWLFDVPDWNPTKSQYDNPGLQSIVATCIATADVVTVSTSALYDRIKPVNKNTVILPNMYVRDRYPYRQDVPPPRNPVFTWRGTQTHEEDLLSVADGFTKLPTKTIFFGGPSRHLIKRMPQDSYSIQGTQDPFLYMKQYYQTAPKVLLFPLLDCFFNRCKSNIAYQEALHAGAICVAPDMPEWVRPGVINYKASDSESFLAAATQAIEMHPDDHAKVVADAYEHMIGIYGAPRVNEYRTQTLHACLAADFEKNPRDPFDQLVGLWALGALTGKEKLPRGISQETLQKSRVS